MPPVSEHLGHGHEGAIYICRLRPTRHSLLSVLLGVPDGAADMPAGECVLRHA